MAVKPLTPYQLKFGDAAKLYLKEDGKGYRGEAGDEVSLLKDDGSTMPLFNTRQPHDLHVGRKYQFYIPLDNLTSIPPEAHGPQ